MRRFAALYYSMMLMVGSIGFALHVYDYEPNPYEFSELVTYVVLFGMAVYAVFAALRGATSNGA